MIASAFIDTNVWLDFLMVQRPNHQKTKSVFEKLFDSVGVVGTSEDILTTVYYVASKSIPKETVLDLFEFLELEIKIHHFGVDIRKRAIEHSRKMLESGNYFDFEDVLQYFCALENGYEFFISNDKNLIKTGACEIVTIDKFETMVTTVF